MILPGLGFYQSGGGGVGDITIIDGPLIVTLTEENIMATVSTDDVVAVVTPEHLIVTGLD